MALGLQKNWRDSTEFQYLPQAASPIINIIHYIINTLC